MQFTKANAIFFRVCIYNVMVVVVSSGHSLRGFFWVKKDFVFLILTDTYNSEKLSCGQQEELLIQAH